MLKFKLYAMCYTLKIKKKLSNGNFMPKATNTVYTSRYTFLYQHLLNINKLKATISIALYFIKFV
jgi:hypothetical protein